MTNYTLKTINKNNLKEILGYEVENELEIIELLNKDILKSIGLESAIIYCYDEIITDKVEDLELDLDNITEARVFNETSEIRIWRDDDLIKGSIFKETITTNNPIEEQFILYPRKQKGYNPETLVVKKYIDYDGDGQAYISYVKPSKLI